MNQPVAQTPVKAPAPEDLGLLGGKGGKYRGRVGLLAVCATGWNMQDRLAPEAHYFAADRAWRGFQGSSPHLAGY